MTLTETVGITKKALIIFFVLAFLGTVAFVGYKIWYAYYLSTLPKPEEKPNFHFGVLPPINFPASAVSSSNYSYSIDTPTGSLPSFDKLIKVYFMPKAAATFLSGDKSVQLAQKLGINSPPQILTETNYHFASDSGKTLNVALDTGNFTYSREASESSVTDPLDSEDKLVNGFKGLLNNLGVLNDDLSSGPSKILYFKFLGGKLFPASNTDGEIAQISLWPKEIDKKPVVTGSVAKSLVVGLVDKSSSDLENLILLDYIFWPVELKSFGTYPLKPANQALAELQNGQGIVIQESTTPQVSITDLKIGYYESETYTPYLQPVYIFTGPSFTAYVPAIVNSQAAASGSAQISPSPSQ